MDTVVAKFGGTSVADARQVEKAADIIRADSRRRVIVVSAPGKRSEEDEKITDILISCHELASCHRDFSRRFSLIRSRFHALGDELGIGTDMALWVDEVEAAIADGADLSAVISRGEYLSARMLARYIGFEFLDSAELIEFSTPARVDMEATGARIVNCVGSGQYVIPGFYGALPDGRVQVFSRGGSDISASLVAGAIGAKLYENWTDVPGLLSADPRVITNPRPISTLSYRELRELAFLGAAVFHEEAVAPVSAHGIPINIRDTNNPQHPGTMITHEAQMGREVTGVAGRTGFRGIYIERAMLCADPEFIPEFETLLRQHSIDLVHTSAGCDSVFSLLRADEEVDWDQLAQKLKDSFAPTRIDTSIKAAAVGAVGIDISRNSMILSRIFQEFSIRGIPIHGARTDYSSYSFTFVVAEEFYAKALTALYDAAIRNG